MLITLVTDSGYRLDADKMKKLEMHVVYRTRFSCNAYFVLKMHSEPDIILQSSSFILLDFTLIYTN